MLRIAIKKNENIEFECGGERVRFRIAGYNGSYQCLFEAAKTVKIKRLKRETNNNGQEEPEGERSEGQNESRHAL